MVITRAQSTINNQTSNTNIDYYSDNDSDISFPVFSSQNVNIRIDSQQMAECERDHERVLIQERFKDMNRQIGELTAPVLTLTEKLSSGNREKNGPNVQRLTTPNHSDTLWNNCSKLEKTCLLQTCNWKMMTRRKIDQKIETPTFLRLEKPNNV